MIHRTWKTVATLLLTTLVAQAQEEPLVVSGGHRFRTAEGDFVPNKGIVIQAGRFKTLDAEPVEGATELKLDDDQYILPGLIDLHAVSYTHLTLPTKA